MSTPRALICQAKRELVSVHAPVEQQDEGQQIGTKSMIVEQPVRKRSVYHSLMQRHDRMHSRHLQG